MQRLFKKRESLYSVSLDWKKVTKSSEGGGGATETRLENLKV